MARKTAIARWEASSKAGIRYDPPWEYKSHFYQAVSGLGGRKKSLLDLGTGTGKVIFETRAYESYEGVFGIDIEPGMIDLARKRARQIGVQVSFIQGDNLDLPFPKESFQIVTSMFSPYTPEEAFRVLAPGGHFILLWGLYGDHRELTSLFPEIFSLWKGRLYFETFAEREERLEKAGLHLLGHTTLQYQWLFEDEKAIRQFYEKISLAGIFEGKEEKLRALKRNAQGKIPVTRIIGTTIARKLSQ